MMSVSTIASSISDIRSTAAFQKPALRDVTERINSLALRILELIAQLISKLNLFKEEKARILGRISSTVEDLGQERYWAVRGVLREIEHLNSPHIEEIRNLLKSVPPEGMAHDYMQMIRRKVSQALEGLDETDISDDRAFFEKVASVIQTQAVAVRPIRAYGEGAIAVTGQTVSHSHSWERFGDLLDQALVKNGQFKRQGLNWVKYVLMFPEKALCGTYLGNASDQQLAENFNGYEWGNANTKIGSYEVNGKRIDFSLGPTVTGDRLFEAHLKQASRDGVVHFQHMLEHPSVQGEAFRRLKTKKIADENKNMFLLATPLDGAAWEGKEAFRHVKTSDEFHEALAAFLFKEGRVSEMPSIDQRAQDNGFYIPENIMGENEIRELIGASRDACRVLERASHWNTMSHEEKCRVMLVVFNTLLSVKALANISAKNQKITMGQACKQDVDRGVVLNVTTRLFTDALARKELDGQAVQELTGIVLTRAQMVDGRQIMDSRYNALKNLLKLMNDQQAFLDAIRPAFNGHSFQGFRSS